MFTDPDVSSTSQRKSRRSPAVTAALVAAFLVVVALRHDFWNWHKARPLLLGVIPVGLWWQAIVSILATLLMWLLVRFAWPGHLENVEDHAENTHNGNSPDEPRP
jgi:hypothetical protein